MFLLRSLENIDSGREELKKGDLKVFLELRNKPEVLLRSPIYLIWLSLTNAFYLFSKNDFCFCIDLSEMLDIIFYSFIFLPMAGVQLKWFSL